VITESICNHPAVNTRTFLPSGAGAGAAAAALATAVVLAGCGGAASPARTSTVDRPPSPTPSAVASTKAECESRPDASGDILVRMTTNGQPAVTQQLGGGWTWNTRSRRCDTPVQAVLATASANAGSCTQVAYVASNPGYRMSVSPAPALKEVVASKGPAC
jgi:hypothetical protein